MYTHIESFINAITLYQQLNRSNIGPRGNVTTFFINFVKLNKAIVKCTKE